MVGSLEDQERVLLAYCTDLAISCGRLCFATVRPKIKDDQGWSCSKVQPTLRQLEARGTVPLRRAAGWSPGWVELSLAD
jgi:hypothetical protein